jgi:hypothetical protein
MPRRLHLSKRQLGQLLRFFVFISHRIGEHACGMVYDERLVRRKNALHASHVDTPKCIPDARSLHTRQRSLRELNKGDELLVLY